MNSIFELYEVNKVDRKFSELSIGDYFISHYELYRKIDINITNKYNAFLIGEYEDEEMLFTFDDDEIVYLVDVEIDYRYR